MTLKEVKQIVADMELSPEATVKIEELLASFNEEDEVGNEVIDKILAIVDVEIEANDLAADIYEAGAAAASEFFENVDDEAGKIADEIDEITQK